MVVLALLIQLYALIISAILKLFTFTTETKISWKKIWITVRLVQLSNILWNFCQKMQCMLGYVQVLNNSE